MTNTFKIGDVFTVTSGGTPSRKKREYFENGTIPWVKTGDLKNKYANTPQEFITDLALKNSSAKIFPENTLLIAMYGATIGACSILPIEAATNQACCAILPSDECDQNYLYYYLTSIKSQLIDQGVGGGQPNISGKIIKETKIPLPPLPTQKKIAAILDAADAYRQKTKILIDKYDELAQSLFLDMFGDPVRNEKGWDLDTSEDHIDLLSGYAFKSKDYSSNPDHIRLCGGLIILPDEIDWDKCNRWSPDKCEGLEKYWLSEGDIVMAMDRPWISSGFKLRILSSEDTPSLLVQRTARIRVKSINRLFFYYVLKSGAFEHYAKPTETTVPHISSKEIKSFRFIMPPEKLQNTFAQRVEHINRQRHIADGVSEKSEELFNSLLQKAFNGELI